MSKAGILLVDKPKGITSRQAIDMVQKWFAGKLPVGHAGTLDPLASGLLVVFLGWSTRLAEYVQNMGKTYRCVFLLGAKSATDDSEGPIEVGKECEIPDLTQIEIALTKFVGWIDQVPPAHSAAWVDGKRAYRLARKGREVSIAPRKVCVKRIQVESYEYPRLQLIIDCGKGTYIRSIARDLGELLGTGGYVENLDRISIGSFLKENALDPNIKPENLDEVLLPPHAALVQYPSYTLPMEAANRMCLGTAIPLPETIKPEHEQGEMILFDETGRFRGLVKMVFAGETKMLTPVKVFHESE